MDRDALTKCLLAGVVSLVLAFVTFTLGRQEAVNTMVGSNCQRIRALEVQVISIERRLDILERMP